ncbi:MAG: hypothetical protein CSA49_04080 [Gammaproteobacteria bacterium]|nr:MAG: hypothetical protein CSA49_04080 [Gammaproteobacteria bacterium]
MIHYLYRRKKDYSRYNIVINFCKEIQIEKDIFILLPFSKNQFIKNFSKRKKIINDFFISNYDTYVYDRKKITKMNPRAWLKYMQDWVNFRFSYYLLSDTQSHFDYWQSLFGKYTGKHMVLPVLADTRIYYPPEKQEKTPVVKILFYGSFIPLHGIEKILTALDKMEKNGLKFQATLLGNGQTYSQMKALKEQLATDQVDMNGEIIDEIALAEIIRNNDIILGIFGDSKKARSVVPNKVYQATACKKCTVTMKSDALLEFYHQDDLVTCDNTSDDLAKTLENLIENRELIDLFAEKGFLRFQEIYQQKKQEFREFLEAV